MKVFFTQPFLLSILTPTEKCAKSQSTQNALTVKNKAQLAEYAQSKKATAVFKPVLVKQTLTYQIICADTHTFGSDILSDTKKLVH